MDVSPLLAQALGIRKRQLRLRVSARHDRQSHSTEHIESFLSPIGCTPMKKRPTDPGFRILDQRIDPNIHSPLNQRYEFRVQLYSL